MWTVTYAIRLDKDRVWRRDADHIRRRLCGTSFAGSPALTFGAAEMMDEPDRSSEEATPPIRLQALEMTSSVAEGRPSRAFRLDPIELPSVELITVCTGCALCIKLVLSQSRSGKLMKHFFFYLNVC